MVTMAVEADVVPALDFLDEISITMWNLHLIT
jgi:hypothetical protein